MSNLHKMLNKVKKNAFNIESLKLVSIFIKGELLKFSGQMEKNKLTKSASKSQSFFQK
jgi:hypothetical protein